jgi:drug/metabolite transporter superfamily protein YnfA
MSTPFNLCSVIFEALCEIAGFFLLYAFLFFLSRKKKTKKAVRGSFSIKMNVFCSLFGNYAGIRLNTPIP